MSLSLPSRLMALQYRVNDATRHRRAVEAARAPATATDFRDFRDTRQCLLVTFKRSGEPVPTPVNLGLSPEADRLWFRTEPHVAKVRRLSREPRVRVCPCTFRGKPSGPVVEATARVLPADASAEAAAAVAANWRADMRAVERGYDRIGVPMVYVELVAHDDEVRSAGDGATLEGAPCPSAQTPSTSPGCG